MPIALEQPDYDVAVCRAGLEGVLAEELAGLGLEVVFRGVRMVAFRGGLREIYLACRALRTAVQVLRPLRKFRARDYERLYHQARKTPWHKLFSPECTLRVDVKGGGSGLRDQRFATYRLKDAIADTFRKLCNGRRPGVSRQAPDVRVVAYLHRDEVTLYLDASGLPLNERGYRLEAGEAPLKEDLAAGLLAMAGWEGKGALVDPMAGSGTLLIEAAWQAQRRAPNRDRSMAFQHWSDYDSAVDHAVRQELLAAEGKPDIRLVACEKDPETVAILRRNLERAELAGLVEVHSGPFQACRMPRPGALVVTNPPYGERLPVAPAALLRELSEWATGAFPGGRLAVFTLRSHPMAQWINLPIKGRSRGLFNGQLEAQLARFDIPDAPAAT